MKRVPTLVRRSVMPAFTAAWASSFLLLAGPAFAQVIFSYEAEDYVDRRDVGAGMPISPQPCSGASGGYAVDGMNVEGEWIEWQESLLAPICFVDSLRTQQPAGEIATFVVEYLDFSTSDIVASDTLVTPAGLGIGCEPEWYVGSRSRRPLCLEPGDYRIRLVLASFGTTRVDLLQLLDAEIPIRPLTWGSIKAAYR